VLYSPLYEAEAVPCSRIPARRHSRRREFCLRPTHHPPIASQPARPSPEWLKSGTIYQIFVRSFSPAGDLNGVRARLDDLHGLGVNVVSLNAFEASIFEKQNK